MSVTIEVTDIAYIIMRVAAVIKNLSAEEVQALINKEAKFKLVFDKPQVKKEAATQEELEKIADTLFKCESTEEVKSHLNRKDFTIPKLKAIAKHERINVTILSNFKKPDIINAIVDSVIGVRLRHESVQRM